MAKAIRVTQWSGGKPAMVYYITQTPQFENVWCTLVTEDGNKVRLSGNITVEEGEFKERPISGRAH